MLDNRSMYIWHLGSAIVHDDVAAAIAKAKKAKLSHLVVKIGDGDTPFENILGAMAKSLLKLVELSKHENIDIYGYHVPHCATPQDARNEAAFVGKILDKFDLVGVFVDNEDGANYFRGHADTAEIYSTNLKSHLAGTGRNIAMSSNDIVSYHPGAYAKVIGKAMNVNAPQVYYGGSPSVSDRLHWAMKENAIFTTPFVPIGAAFVSPPGKDDGGCSTPTECGTRALSFIKLVSLLHDSNPTKFPGYGFWNWEEAPAEVWEVLSSTPVFVLPAAPNPNVHSTPG